MRRAHYTCDAGGSLGKGLKLPAEAQGLGARTACCPVSEHPRPPACAPLPRARAPQTMPYWSYARGEIMHHAKLKHPFIVDLREIFLTRGEPRSMLAKGWLAGVRPLGAWQHAASTAVRMAWHAPVASARSRPMHCRCRLRVRGHGVRIRRHAARLPAEPVPGPPAQVRWLQGRRGVCVGAYLCALGVP